MAVSLADRFEPLDGVYAEGVTTSVAKTLTESGIGGMMPWANKLWFTSYLSSQDQGDGAGLWSMDETFKPVLVSKTNGCHAGRWVHKGTYQAIVGIHAIDADGGVHAITGIDAADRITGWCDYPGDTAASALALSMGGQIYKVDMTTYAATKPTAGNAKTGLSIVGQAHFKSVWRTESDRVIVCANLMPPDGRLGYWKPTVDNSWTTVDSGNSWVEVMGSYDDTIGNQVFAFGLSPNGGCLMWLLSALGVAGQKMRLPAAHFQQYHGWQQEWMRCRPSGATERYLLNLHGTWFMVSPALDPTSNLPRVQPISTFYGTITDHTSWRGKFLLGRNDVTFQDGKWPHAGQSQSGITVLDSVDELYKLGRPQGSTSINTNSNVADATTSDKVLLRGYQLKALHIANAGAVDIVVDINAFIEGKRYIYKKIPVPCGKLGTVTVTIASPGVFSLTAHGLAANDEVAFATTGALPTGLTAGTTYFVISTGLTADAFEVAATPGGAAINTSGSQSGTHTVSKPGLNYVHEEFPDGWGADWITLTNHGACTDFTAWMTYP